METFGLAIISALWLGILTSISPCPLATNVAAVSYIGKQVNRPLLAIISSFLYILGRAFAYFAVASIIIQGLSSIPTIANFLQKNMNIILGPILIFTSLLILEVFPSSWLGLGISEKVQKIVMKTGICGSFILGLLFALAFCPISAALYFGSLIPISIKYQSVIIMPSIYGIGTALPVVIFALILVFAANRLSHIFNAITVFEKWTRRITAIIFFGVGIYYCINI